MTRTALRFALSGFLAVAPGCGERPEPWYLQRPCDGHPLGCLSIFLDGHRDIRDLKLSYSLYPQDGHWTDFANLPLRSWPGPHSLPFVAAVDLPTLPPYKWVRVLYFRWKAPDGTDRSMDWDFWYRGWTVETAEADPLDWNLNLRFYLDDPPAKGK